MVTKEGKQKIKALMPSLREKKRYISFEAISEKRLSGQGVFKAIIDSFSRIYGEEGIAKSGLMILKNKYNPEKNRGIIRINNKWADKLRLSLAMIKQVENAPVIMKSITTSGMIKKAEETINA